MPGPGMPACAQARRGGGRQTRVKPPAPAVCCPTSKGGPARMHPRSPAPRYGQVLGWHGCWWAFGRAGCAAGVGRGRLTAKGGHAIGAPWGRHAQAHWSSGEASWRLEPHGGWGLRGGWWCMRAGVCWGPGVGRAGAGGGAARVPPPPPLTGRAAGCDAGAMLPGAAGEAAAACKVTKGHCCMHAGSGPRAPAAAQAGRGAGSRRMRTRAALTAGAAAAPLPGAGAPPPWPAACHKQARVAVRRAGGQRGACSAASTCLSSRPAAWLPDHVPPWLCSAPVAGGAGWRGWEGAERDLSICGRWRVSVVAGPLCSTVAQVQRRRPWPGLGQARTPPASCGGTQGQTRRQQRGRAKPEWAPHSWTCTRACGPFRAVWRVRG